MQLCNPGVMRNLTRDLHQKGSGGVSFITTLH